MISGRKAAERYGCIALLLLGYAVLVHYSNLSPSAKPLGAVLASAPPLALGLGLTWRSGYRLVALALAALLATLIFLHWQVLQSNYPLLYLLEDVTVYALLSMTFARSLLRGHVPLCTYWADLVQGPLPAVVARYTRKTTAAWALFFALIAGMSLALYQWSPLRIWSAFSNFGTLPLVVLMFVGEYAVRLRVLPPQHRTGLLTSVRVYLDSSSRHTRIVRQ
jgi:uncharacterized membrane protein